MQDVFAKVERHECLAGMLTIAVDAECNGGCGPKGAAKRDNAEKDGRNDPAIMNLGGPSKSYQPDDGGDGHGSDHNETKFRFIEPAVTSRYRTYDDIANLAGDHSTQDAADKGREIDQTSRQC